MALVGWVKGHERQGIDIAEFPNVGRWLERLQARPAVQRGLALGEERRSNLADDKEAQKILFGQRAR
jgi:GST-like protein